MPAALIALGANLGPREKTFRQAIDLMCRDVAHGSPQVSRWHESAPVGGPSDQPPFLNAAALLQTHLVSRELLQRLQEIERILGRQRHERWAARTLDLDLLLYDEEVIDEPDLVVPHPRMAFRRFVVEPAAEIAGSLRHPTLDWTLAQLQSHLRDAFPYVAVTAADPTVAARLADELTHLTGGSRLAAPRPPWHESTSERPGCREDAAIEFLESCAAETARLCGREAKGRKGPTEPKEIVIGDYWLEELRRQARPWLAAPAAREPVALGRVLPPKLLIWLESPAYPFRQPPQLPAVRASAADLPRAVEEAAAAMTAMQATV